MTNETSVGTAYGFFDCYASKNEIESELPNMLHMAGSPGGLELSLMEVKDLEGNVETDQNLLQFIKQNNIYGTFSSKKRDQMATAKPIQMTDLRYVIKATSPNTINEDVANELSYVMNMIDQNYNLDPFNVAIAYKIDDEYFFKE